MGEETDGVVESVSKMQEKIKGLTGVDILTDSGAYKDTYSILYEIGQVWNDLENLDRSALLELMAGKNRANTLAAILNNMEDLEGAYESALNAEGSALRENEAYLDSIQGRIDLFKNSLQTMWMNLIDSDALKFLVDAGTWFVKLIDNAGVFQSILTVIGGIFLKKNFSHLLFGDIKSATKDIKQLEIAVDNAKKKWESSKSSKDYEDYQKEKQNLEAYKAEFNTDDASKNAKQLETDVDNVKQATEDLGDISETTGNKMSQVLDNVKIKAAELGNTIKTKISSALVYIGKIAGSMAISYAISTAMDLMYKAGKAIAESTRNGSNSVEVLQEKYQDLSSQLSSCKSDIKSFESELKTTNAQIEELISQGTLSFTEQEELERLQAISAELERQITMKETLQSSLQAGTNAAAINAGNAYLSSSFDSEKSKTERQEAAQETGETIGKAIGLAAGAIIGVLLAPLTAGTSLAISAGTAAVIGAGAGSALFGLAGGAIGSVNAGIVYDQEQTISDAISKMNESRDKLIKARDDTYAAYVSDPTNADKMEEYEAASQALSLYDEKMANHISTMSQYYNTIMSNWENASNEQKEQAKLYGDILDKYSIEMNGVNAKQNAINRIFGSEASSELQAVKNELEKMADAGKKIDLKEAFGGDVSAYDAFVDRLHEMGIYIYECEDAFKEMHQAALEASEVSFTDVANDIKSVTDAVSGMKGAFIEFLENGSVSAGTILDLEEYFNTDKLKALYNEYVGIMTSGSTSIEEAQESTRKLAQSYLDDRISVGDITDAQKQVYITQLKELGIKNAEEFVAHELQRTAIEAVQNEYASNGAVATNKLDEIAKKYGVEIDLLDQLIPKLEYKNELESSVDEIKNDKVAYDKYRAQYNAVYEDILSKQKYTGKYSDQIKNFNTSDWSHSNEYAPGVVYNTKTGEELSLNEFNALIRQYEDYQKKIDELEELQNKYNDILSEGFKRGFLNNDGSLKDGIEDGFAIALQEAENTLKQAELEIETELGFEIDLELIDKPIIDTVSGLTDALEKYKAALEVVNDISFDGQQISEDCYNTLREQLEDVTVGTEDFFDAVDTSNGYIVKNTKLLQKLVAQSKQAQKATVQVAKAQTQLEYRNLIQQIAGSVEAMVLEYKAYGLVTDATYNNISAMRKQLDMLKQTMQQYALLEISLSNAAEAYAEYEKAKSRDAELIYDDSFLEMLKTIDEGILNNETGTEAFEYAVKAVVPEEFWKDIDDVDKKIRSIHDYIDGDNVFSKFFHVDEESGELDINADNVRSFVDYGLRDDVGVFAGDSKDFSLSSDMSGLEDVAKAYGVTEAAILAMFTALEDVDAKWGNILTDVMSTPLEREVNKQVNSFDVATSAVEDYWKAVISGKETYDDEKHEELIKTAEDAAEEYAKAEQAANDSAKSWSLCQSVISAYRGELSLTQKEADALAKSLGLVDENGNPNLTIGSDGTLQLTGDQLDLVISKIRELEEPAIVRMQLRYDEIIAEIAQIQKYIDEGCKGTITIDGIVIANQQQAQAKIDELAPEKKNIEFTYGITETTTEQDKSILESYKELAKNGVEFTVTAIVDGAKEGLDAVYDAQSNIKEKQEITIISHSNTAEQAIKDVADQLDRITSKTVTLTVHVAKKETVTTDDSNTDIDTNTGNNTNAVIKPSRGTRGYTRALGNARAIGKDGLKHSEHNSVVGELGPEMVVDPIKGVYYTVGNNGTEMVDLPRGAIIYNHKQTEELLKNGHTTRGTYTGGLSFASGNAYEYGIPSYHPNTEDSTSLKNGSGVNNSWDDAVSTLSDAASDISGSADEFAETIDWIEVRMEELEEALGLLSAQLENASNYAAKSAIIDAMVAKNKEKYADSLAGAAYYETKAAEYLGKLSSYYQSLAQNGDISVEDFTSEADEATIEAINKYREYAQKAADLTQQAEEVITEIRNIAIQRIDEAYESGKVRADVEDSQTEKLQNRVDLDEEMGLVTSDAYYIAMMENSNKKIEYLTSARENMQKTLDTAVRNGELIKGSNEWYEQINELYGIDAEIAEATIELEEFQNAINDIHWDNFENLTNQIDYLKGQTQSLIDLMEKSGDLVVNPGKDSNVEYWTVDDVKWTDEGIATLGLYAQQMEIAEFEAKQYAEAIDELNEQYAAGRYSESEYLEKLEELTSAQYDSIEAYYDAQDAIIELNEARIDMIKDGIEKEIDAYEELINKKKEALEADKDAHDFQKNVMDQQKNISDIQRRLDALSLDNSASARAQKAKLEAELVEAMADLNETYLDRSVSDQQDALDKELEDFQETKNQEIEKWEKYLENVELVIADSLNTIQNNAVNIYDILNGKAQEYDLTLSDAIMSPWQDGALAVDDYQQHFGNAMSSTMNQLNALKNKWQEVISQMAEAGRLNVELINRENSNYASATQQHGRDDWYTDRNNLNNNSNNYNQQQSSGAIRVGGKINAGNATIYQNNAGGGGGKQYFSNDPIYTVLDEKNGYILVRHHSISSGFSGWFRKSDVRALASGTTNLGKSGIVNIDELGEELVIRAQNGRLTYMEKGSGVVPASLTENLMEWGKLDPASMIEQNRPSITAPVVQNKEVNIELTYGDILHIEEFHGEDPDEIAKIVAKQFDKHTKNLNNAIRKFAR